LGLISTFSPKGSRYFKKTFISLLLLFSTITLGISGFIIIEHYTLSEAFYMTIITLSTVGFTEVKPLSEAGRIFTSFLIITNIGIFAYVVTIITSFILGGEFKYIFKGQSLKKKIGQLKDHVIVCGYGRNGQQVCEELQSSDQTYVVIEKDHAILESLRETSSLLFIDGDATNDKVLSQTQVQHARSLITTLPKDADNLYVVLTARELNPELNIISRASDDVSVHKLRIGGANSVIMPEKIGGSYMASLVIHPDVVEFVAMLTGQGGVNITFEEFAYENFSDTYKNKTIKDMDVRNRTGANIIGIKTKDNEYVVNPSADTVLAPETKLIILGTEEQIDQCKKLF